MGKKSRKAKAKTSDFQKVKLKVGKKRPLPTNVTEVAFKSQSIYIPEQLKAGASANDENTGKGGSGSKNVPELLSQVGHFNSNFRVDSLTSLRLFFTNNKQLIHEHLPKIIEKVPRTIADEEQQVRKSSIAFFKVIFANLGEQEMAPFFDVLLSHLYCAMSHIFDDVQKDSLQIVDLCIENFPGLLSHKARNTLLQHFIELISTKQTKSAASKSKGSKTNPGVTRVLSMKLSNKESSIVWRNRILKRLNSLLQISTFSNKSSSESGMWKKYLKNHFRESDGNLGFEDGIRCRWDGKGIGEVLTQFESEKLSLPSFSLRSNPLSTITSLNDGEDGELSPWSLISTLFPLLFDCWHEATSDNSKGFTAESKDTMSSALNIVNVLVSRYLESSDSKEEAIAVLRDMFMKDFKQYFFESFPFSELTGRQPGGKKKKVNQESSVNIQEINLAICALVTTLATEQTLNEDSETLSNVAAYLSMVIVSVGSNGDMILDSTSFDGCITSVAKLLEIAVNDETKVNLLQPLLLLYHTLNPGCSEKLRLLHFFLDLHSNKKDIDLSSNEVMTEWLCSLPKLLNEIISSKKGTLCSDSSKELLQLTIRCIRHACVQRNDQFLSCLEGERNGLFEVLRKNASSLFCPTCCDETRKSCNICSSLQAHLLEVLIHHSPTLSKEDATVLSQICSKIHIMPENVIYTIEMVTQLFQDGESPEDFVVMLQFIFSVLIGTSKQELQSSQCANASEQSYFQYLSSTNPQEFYRHSQIVEKLCQILPTIEQSLPLLQHFLCEKILKHFHFLPEKSAYGILKAGQMLLKQAIIDTYKLKALAENLGSLGAKVLLDYNNSESTMDSHVQESLLQALFVLLEKKEVLAYCIQSLLKTDLQDSVIWKSTCHIVETLTSNTALYESLVGCQDKLETLMASLKSNKKSEELFQATKLRMSLLLKK